MIWVCCSVRECVCVVDVVVVEMLKSFCGGGGRVGDWGPCHALSLHY